MGNRYQSGIVQELAADGMTGTILSDSGLLLPFNLAGATTASKSGYIRGGDIGGALRTGDKVTFTTDSIGHAKNIKKPMLSHRSYSQVAHNRYIRQGYRY